jgi:hypothetical protein
MSAYKVIQLTSNNLGAITAGSYLKLGNVTRKINCKNYDAVPFSTSTTDTTNVVINESGYYRVTYTATLIAGAAGVIGVSLVSNNATLYTVSETVAAEGDSVNLALVYEVRVCPNSDCNPYNIPVNIQMLLNTVAITGGTSNLLVEKVY